DGGIELGALGGQLAQLEIELLEPVAHAVLQLDRPIAVEALEIRSGRELRRTLQRNPALRKIARPLGVGQCALDLPGVAGHGVGAVQSVRLAVARDGQGRGAGKSAPEMGESGMKVLARGAAAPPRPK